MIDARNKRTHTVRDMLEWLHSEGHTDVTMPALTNWFQRRQAESK